MSSALILPADVAGVTLPALIDQAGDQARRRFVEFFTANIRNKNTRAAYARAAGQFLTWCDGHGLTLPAIQPVHVAAYIEQHPASAPTVKQHLAAIRTLLDWLVVGQVIPYNPATSVRGPKHSTESGKTPVLAAEEARQLLASIDTGDVIALRDRALIAVMLYSFARISAVVGMQVADYFPAGKRWKLRLHEKGGKYREIPAHHQAEEYLDAYLEVAGIREQKKTPLFRAANPKRELTENALDRTHAYRIIRRRARQSGLPDAMMIGCHSMRGTGITAYLDAGGQLETAQSIAGHSSPRTTKLYDRRRQQVELSEIERIRF